MLSIYSYKSYITLHVYSYIQVPSTSTTPATLYTTPTDTTILTATAVVVVVVVVAAVVQVRRCRNPKNRCGFRLGELDHLNMQVYIIYYVYINAVIILFSVFICIWRSTYKLFYILTITLLQAHIYTCIVIWLV